MVKSWAIAVTLVFAEAILGAWLILAQTEAARAEAEATPPRPLLRIVLLDSFHGNLLFSKNFQAGLREVLDASGRRYRLYVEYLDATRFAEERQKQLKAAFLSEKYADEPIDLVIANSRPAGDLLVENASLFGPARRLYANGPRTEARATRPRDGVLVHARFAFDQSLSEVMRLAKPSALYVAADASAPAARSRLQRLREAVDTLGLTLPVHYLVDLPLADLLDRVSSLPAGSAVYSLGIFQDGTGRKLVPLEVTRMLAERASAPVFTYWKAKGSGAVGGLVLSADELGRVTGLAALSGPDQGVIDTTALSYIYDWRALDRWGLNDVPLPADATVLFREPTIWEAYTAEVVSALVTGILLIALSAALFAAVVARRRSEAHLAEMNADLHIALNDRNVLLGEVNHRVKNNLQMINAMLTIEAKAAGDVPKAVLTTTAERVRALATVQDVLVTAVNPSRLTADQFLSALCSDLAATLSAADGSVTITVSASPLPLDADNVMHLGLLVNELLSRTLTAPSPTPEARRITIAYHLHDAEEGTAELVVADADQPQLTATEDGSAVDAGGGPTILSVLVWQAGGRLRMHRDARGSLASVILPVSA